MAIQDPEMHDVPENFQPISEPISIRNHDRPLGRWKGRCGQTLVVTE